MSKSESVNILLMEDDLGLARLIRRKLERLGYRVDIARDGEEGLSMCAANSYDVLAVDQSMPIHDGLDVIRVLASSGSPPPIIMVTGTGDEKIAVEAMKLGARDYIVKDVGGKYIELLPTVIDRLIQQQRLFEEKQRTEEALKESEARYRSLFEDMPVGLYRTTPAGKFLNANPALVEMLGYPDRESLMRTNVVDLYVDPETRRRWQFLIEREDMVGDFEAQWRCQDGSIIWVEDNARVVRDADGRASYYEGSLKDITERKRMRDMEQIKSRLEEENVYLREEIKSEYDFKGIVGSSPALMQVLRSVRRVATTSATVLVRGETGTGKELISRAIHNLSNRGDRALVKVNCPAIPRELFESELFGHERGSFTGAIARKIGKFELADSGSIFLDEVAEIPVEAQAKLLRVLQEGEFERVGGTSTIKVDVRIIATSNRDLEKAVDRGRLREDLFYRLNIFPIFVPPLRDRKEDIPALASYFTEKYSIKMGKYIKGISDRAMEALVNYDWSGNVRELEGVMQRAVIVSDGGIIRHNDLPFRFSVNVGTEQKFLTLEEHQRNYIIEVLESTDWVIEGDKGAAKSLGVKPSTLRSRMKKLGIQRHETSTKNPARR